MILSGEYSISQFLHYRLDILRGYRLDILRGGVFCQPSLILEARSSLKIFRRGILGRAY